MASFDVAKLLNKITQDIPGINTVLKALAKWDVSALTNVPDGAMQATTDANNNLTIKKKVSGSYTPVAKLMHDVDKLDGYHASTSATANAIAVRNSSGALPGNVTGNAATADTATALAAGSVVPVNNGGTGATTASQARANLGVADGADFTSHIAKQASPSVEGHVKLDALAADGSNTAAPGGFGLGMPLAAQIPANTDLDTVVLPGFYSCRQSATATTLTNCPVAFTFSMLVEYGAYGPTQTITGYDGARFQRTKSSSTTFGPWRSLPNGISNSTSTTSSTIAASATAVKAVNDLAVHLTGAETISGDKTFTGLLYQNSISPTIKQKHTTLTAEAPPSTDTTYAGIITEDARGVNTGGIAFIYQSSGVRKCQIGFPNSTGTGRIWPLVITVAADDTSYATVTPPPAGDNSSKIATTAWVKTRFDQLLGASNQNVITASGSFVVPENGTYEVVAIGGGGAGGTGGNASEGYSGGYVIGSGGGAGGGGAGQVITQQIALNNGVSIPVTIGDSGGITTFGTYITALAGGRGNNGGSSSGCGCNCGNNNDRYFSGPGTGGAGGYSYGSTAMTGGAGTSGSYSYRTCNGGAGGTGGVSTEGIYGNGGNGGDGQGIRNPQAGCSTQYFGSTAGTAGTQGCVKIRLVLGS